MGRCAIMVVDDEAIIAMALRQELRSFLGSRFRYETAQDAERALEGLERLAAEGVKVLLVISDWLMPGIKGDEFLTIVHERYPGIRSVMITGQADEDAARRAREGAKVVSVLSKPWNARELRVLVEGICAGSGEEPA